MPVTDNSKVPAGAVILIHGREKHKVELPHTLSEFRALVAEKTDIAATNQKLIAFGRELQGDDDSSLASLGLTAGKRVMVMRGPPREKPVNNSVQESCPYLAKVHEQNAVLERIEYSLAAARQAVKDLVWAEAAETEKNHMRMEVLRVQEQCMRVLEILDSISGPSGDWKDERKRTVRKAQALLDDGDTLAADIAGK